MSECAIVVPAFNEHGVIGAVVRDLSETAPVIVVDDASTDDTAEEAVGAGASVIRLARNSGYGAAIDAGFREAVASGYRFVVTADGDGQHEPSEVAAFVDALVRGEADLIVGIRPHTVRASEQLCSLYARLRFGLLDPLCGLKGYDVRFYEAYGGFDKRHSVGTELMTYALRNGAKWLQRPITLHDRRGGSSRFYASFRGNMRILRSLWALIRVR